MKTLTEFSPILLRHGREVLAAKAAEGLEGEALNEAVAAALSLSPERTTRLLEALEVVGDLGAIRLVRVFQGEAGPSGSMSRGEFHYVVDRVVTAIAGRDRRDRGGRGGGRGDRRGGGGRGAGAPRGDRDDGPRGGPRAGAADRQTPRAGEGWQLTSAPRDPRSRPDGAKGPPGAGRGPKPGRPPGDRRPGRGGAPSGPRLGPDGKPLPPRWPDANGNGPDGQPWRGGRRGGGTRAEPASQRSAPTPTAAPEAVSPPPETANSKPDVESSK